MKELCVELDFSNCHNFENIDDVILSLFRKKVIDLIAPIMSRWIKQNTEEWFED